MLPDFYQIGKGWPVFLCTAFSRERSRASLVKFHEKISACTIDANAVASTVSKKCTSITVILLDKKNLDEAKSSLDTHLTFDLKRATHFILKE
eukprot:UN28283